MLLENDGLRLWYDTDDAPLIRRPDAMSVTIGVAPADAGNEVELIYQVNAGPCLRLPARWLRTDPSGAVQYFRAVIPAASRDVHYTAVCRCAGRQVPADATSTHRHQHDETRHRRAPDLSRPRWRSLPVCCRRLPTPFHRHPTPRSQRREEPSCPEGITIGSADVATGLRRLRQAPYLSYNVPDPTSYPGRTYTVLTFAPEHDPFGVPVAMTEPGRVEPTVQAHMTDVAPRLAVGEDQKIIALPMSASLADWTGILGLTTEATRALGQERSEVPHEREPYERPNDPANREHPAPEAIVTIVTPAKGADITVDEGGAVIDVVVKVKFENTGGVPAGSVTLTAPGVADSAMRTTQRSCPSLRWASRPSTPRPTMRRRRQAQGFSECRQVPGGA